MDVTAAKEFVTAYLPGAEVLKKFGNASFCVNGKVFAFTRPQGLVLKLPPDAIQKVLSERDAGPLVMGKRVMREWVLLQLGDGEAYPRELDLMRAAMSYVGSAPLAPQASDKSVGVGNLEKNRRAVAARRKKN